MSITIDIKKRYFLNLTLALLLTVFFLTTAFLPYFYYGQEEAVFAPEEGKLELLNCAWTNGVDDGDEGFVRINIAGKKDITVERVVNGALIETKANYKYSRSSQELTINFEDASGETVYSTKCTFLPEISFGGTGEATLVQYLLRPTLHPGLTEELLVEDPDYFINDVIVLPIVLTLLVLLGVVVCCASKDIWIPGAYAIVLGAVGIWGCMSNELLRYGQGRSTHLIYYVVILLAAVMMLVARKHRYFCED